MFFLMFFWGFYVILYFDRDNNGISLTNHLYVFSGMLLLVDKCDQMSV